MKKKQFDLYINKNYSRWLEIASYYCQQAGLNGEGEDLLNEVLCSILASKSVEILHAMVKSGKTDKTEFDRLVYKAIEINIYSQTAPYRHRYHHPDCPKFRESFSPDTSAFNPDEMTNQGLIDLVRDALEHVNIELQKKEVFAYYYLENGNLKDWEGPEALKTLYKMKKEVLDKIREYLKKNP